MSILTNVLTRARRFIAKTASEGEPRPGPYLLPESGGSLSSLAGSFMNWWQLGFSISGGTAPSAMVEACISAYSQTVAMCPGDHWLANPKGGRDRVTTSALSRILRHPNSYQSMSDFMLNLTRHLYSTGNAYALALRNDRYEVSELHIMNSMMSYPLVAETGDIFYSLGGNDVIRSSLGDNLMVPQRDVLHVRLHTARRYPFPLIGETPLMAAMKDIAMGDAIVEQQLQFYLNQARPSIILMTEAQLDKDQIKVLRDRWNEQTQGKGAGGTPILASGLKAQPIQSLTSKDAELSEVMKISDQKIALAFRIPLQILGVSGQAPYSSTELLMQAWIASGLGFALNQIEEEFGMLFNLWGQPDEYVEFNTSALLRSAMKDRIDALVKGVQGGVFSPNEARNIEGYDDVKFGDEPRVQQQVVPLSAAGAIPPPGPKAPPSPPSAPAPPAAPADAAPKPTPPEPPPPKKAINDDDIRLLSRQLLSTADEYDRRRFAA